MNRRGFSAILVGSLLIATINIRSHLTRSASLLVVVTDGNPSTRRRA